MRSVFASLAIALLVSTGLNPAGAQMLNETAQTEVCTKSPMDAQCKGDAIALDDRPGEAGACTIIANNVEHQTVCKLVVANQRVIAYYELGPKLESLRDHKATREVQISPSNIKGIGYKEGEKDNSTARVVNALLFGVGGLFGTRNKKVAVITVDYTLPQQTLSGSQPAEPKAETLESSSETLNPQAEEMTHTLKIMVRRRTGEDLRRQLEQLTGIRSMVQKN